MQMIACTPHMAKTLHQLECSCFSDPWSESAFLFEMKFPQNHYYIMQQDDVFIGYYGMSILLDECHIHNLCILPAFQKKGFGKQLLQHLLLKAFAFGAHSATLEVRASNIAAISLYEKMGFQKEGKRIHYYSNGEDALIYWKHNLGCSQNMEIS